MRRALLLVTLVLAACQAAPFSPPPPVPRGPVLAADVRACDAGELVHCLPIARRTLVGSPAERPEAGALRQRWQIGCTAGRFDDCFRTAVVVSPKDDPRRWVALMGRACHGDVGLACYLLGDTMVASLPDARERGMLLLDRACALGVERGCARAACHRGDGPCETRAGRR
jgi:hypothetical protein